MTFDEMNVHLSLVQELNAAREMLESLKASSINTSSIYDVWMPTSKETLKRRTESLAISISELESHISALEKKVDRSSVDVLAFIDEAPDRYTALILRLRFIDGYSWREVVNIIGGGNSVEGVKAYIYRYFRSLSKTAP